MRIPNEMLIYTYIYKVSSLEDLIWLILFVTVDTL